MSGSQDPGNPGTPPDPGTGGAAPATWLDGLDAETRGYVENKAWSTPADVINGYKNLESFRGVPEDRLVKLPSADADAKAWDEVYNRLGRPQDAKEYEITVPDGADGAFADWARDNFHKLGFTKAQAKGLTEGWNTYVAEQVSQIQQQAQLRAEEAQTALKKEWGAKYETNVAVVNRTAAQLGLADEELAALRDALGHDKAMKFMANLGAKLGEDQFVTGDGNNGFGNAMTPAQAEARIAQLKADEQFRKRYLAGEPAATAEMSRLHRWAYGKSQ